MFHYAWNIYLYKGELTKLLRELTEEVKEIDKIINQKTIKEEDNKIII